jgi:transcriptional regulator with XRE-family HTH domain
MRTPGQRIKCSEYDKKYGYELKIVRSANKLKLEDVAKYLDVTSQQYIKYEKGKNKISIATENKIAQLLGMTRSELVKRIEQCIID